MGNDPPNTPTPSDIPVPVTIPMVSLLLLEEEEDECDGVIVSPPPPPAAVAAPTPTVLLLFKVFFKLGGFGVGGASTSALLRAGSLACINDNSTAFLGNGNRSLIIVLTGGA